MSLRGQRRGARTPYSIWRESPEAFWLTAAPSTGPLCPFDQIPFHATGRLFEMLGGNRALSTSARAPSVQRPNIILASRLTKTFVAGGSHGLSPCIGLAAPEHGHRHNEWNMTNGSANEIPAGLAIFMGRSRAPHCVPHQASQKWDSGRRGSSLDIACICPSFRWTGVGLQGTRRPPCYQQMCQVALHCSCFGRETTPGIQNEGEDEEDRARGFSCARLTH